MVGDSSWLGPQTVLEGRPAALLEASVEDRTALSLFEAWIPETAVFAVQSLLKTA